MVSDNPGLRPNKMSVLEMTRNFEKNFSGKHIKMNSKTVRESRSIGLHGYYKLKADLVALLLEQSSEEMPTPRLRASGKERRQVLSVKIVSSPQEMDEFEKRR